MDEISRDHQSIRDALSELESFIGREQERTDRPAGPMLASIARSLVDHFRREESSDLYVGLPRRMPELASKLADLRVEHGTITELAIDAQGAAERLQSSRREVVGLVRRLIDTVRAHERAEVELLQRDFLAK